MSPIVIGLAVVLFAVVALIVVSMMRPAQTDVIGDRLSQFTERTMTLDELPSSRHSSPARIGIFIVAK